MSEDKVVVDTGDLRAAYDAYESLHTSMATGSIEQPSGMDRSTAKAIEACGVIGEGVSKVVSSIGELSGSLWEVAKHYDGVDIEVVHDFSEHD